jgi:hypothetical protein
MRNGALVIHMILKEKVPQVACAPGHTAPGGACARRASRETGVGK